MSTRDRSPAAGDRAYHWTKDRILDGRLEGGRLISEGEVAGKMSAILDRQRAVGVPEHIAEFTKLDREFHATLVEAAGNALFDEFCSGLRDRQLRMVSIALRDNTVRPAIILEEHRRICDLLAAGDTEALHDLIDDHIAAVRDGVSHLS